MVSGLPYKEGRLKVFTFADNIFPIRLDRPRITSGYVPKQDKSRIIL